MQTLRFEQKKPLTRTTTGEVERTAITRSAQRLQFTSQTRARAHTHKIRNDLSKQ